MVDGDGVKLASKLQASEIPEELRALRQWVGWRMDTSDAGKPTKIPINPLTGKKAATTRPSTWGTFQQALEALGKEAWGLAGVGFVFSADDPYCGLDWDKCRKEGVIAKEQADQIRSMKSYGEVSQSGNGAHVICKGSLPPNGRRKGGIEMYDRERFFVMTGDRLIFCPGTIEHRQEEIDALHGVVFQRKDRAHSGPQVVVGDILLDGSASPPLALWEALCENDAKFRRAWLRKRPDLADQSASTYDLSLATRAAQANWTDQQIADLVIASRRKHGDDLKLRLDYYQRTIRTARASAVGDHAELLRMDMGVESSQAAEEMPADDKRKAISSRLGLSGGLEIARWVRVKTEPGIYRIFLGDGSTIDLGGIEGLRDQNKFASRVADCAKREIKPLNKGQWVALRDMIYTVLEDLDPGEEGSPLHDLSHMVSNYLEKTRPVGGDDWKDAALQFNPIAHGGFICVSIRGINKHRMSIGLKQESGPKLASQLKLLGWHSRKLCYRVGEDVLYRNYWGKEEAQLRESLSQSKRASA